MAIPAKLEELILDGKARFETYQAGYTDFNVIPVQSKEFIVITGFTFYPAFAVRYDDAGSAVATIQRVEFYDGNNYSHHIAKMSGEQGGLQDNEHHYLRQSDLYNVFHNDVGVMVTVPINGNLNWDAFTDDIDGSNGNSARKVINQGTNPYLTPGAEQMTLYQTEGASAGTMNIPANVKVNGPNYTNNMAAGPYAGQETNQFQFTAENQPHYYSTVSNYLQVDPNKLRLGWYLNVQYVRVFNSGTNVR